VAEQAATLLEQNAVLTAEPVLAVKIAARRAVCLRAKSAARQDGAVLPRRVARMLGNVVWPVRNVVLAFVSDPYPPLRYLVDLCSFRLS
jgi:hypothetical protein